MFRIRGRKSDKDPAARPIDSQLHVLVSRSTTVTSLSKASSIHDSRPSLSAGTPKPLPSKGLASTATTRPRLHERRDTLPLSIRPPGEGNPPPRIDEQMHVLTGRPKAPSSVASSVIEAPLRSAPPMHSTQPPMMSPVPPMPLSSAVASFPASVTSNPPSSGRSDVNPILRRLRPPPIPPDAPLPIIAGCIAEVLGIQDSHGVLEFLETAESAVSLQTARSRRDSISFPAGPVPRSHRRQSSMSSIYAPPARPHADLLPRLAIKAKGLSDDNRRLHAEVRDLHAKRDELEAQLKRVQSAMENMVRVAEILNVRPRLTPPSTPPSVSSSSTSVASSDTDSGGRGPRCADCGTLCPTCATGVKPIMDRRELARSTQPWSLVAKGAAPSMDGSSDDGSCGRLRIPPPPPPRRARSAPSIDMIPVPSVAPSPTAIRLLDEDDCGVSLNRFRIKDDVDDSVDEDELADKIEVLRDEYKPIASLKELQGDLEATKDGTPRSPLKDASGFTKATSTDVQLAEVKDVPTSPTAPLAEMRPVSLIKASDENNPVARRASLIIGYECDKTGNALTTTTDIAEGDFIVLKTEFNGLQRHMSMCLEPSTQSLKFKMVTATVSCPAIGVGATEMPAAAGAAASALSTSMSVLTDAAETRTSVDEADVADVSLLTEGDPLVQGAPAAGQTEAEQERTAKGTEPDAAPPGYPWW